IPMTPLQAIIKNVISIVIIGFVYWKTPKKENSLHRYPLLIFAISGLFIFLRYPMECCCDAKPIVAPIPITSPQPINAAPAIDTTKLQVDAVKNIKDTVNRKLSKTKGSVKASVTTEKSEKTKISTPAEATLPRVVSEFAPYTQFSDGTINLDEGKNIVCVFNTTCDHCMETAKAMCQVSKAQKLPPIRILFWSEMDAKGEALDKEISAFFAFSGCKWPYTVVDVKTFFRMLGKAPSPPRVAVLHEGNIVADLSSLNFSKEALIKAVK
ncbi:MAG TPA: hypothetical protein VL947_03195, partial [Cytophagales bacterium]|nr:hypothetical protein [Cytophagales bacterium]